VVREWKKPKRVAQTHRGQYLRQKIGLLEELIEAYRRNDLPQQ
jgi:hypothetical protein